MRYVQEMSSERIRANNSRFKAANETIRDKVEEIGVDIDRIPFLCECPVEDCVAIVPLTHEEYTALRAHPRYFMTAVGHESAEQPVAQIVARHDGYVVVEKGGVDDDS